jgi:hypothetical protein
MNNESILLVVMAAWSILAALFLTDPASDVLVVLYLAIDPDRNIATTS